VVEIDGYAFHSTRRAFEGDHRTDSDLRAAGMTVSRYTWRQLTDDATAVIVEVAQALARVAG
jgi:very-short-patch-repair endonuclease